MLTRFLYSFCFITFISSLSYSQGGHYGGDNKVKMNCYSISEITVKPRFIKPYFLTSGLWKEISSYDSIDEPTFYTTKDMKLLNGIVNDITLHQYGRLKNKTTFINGKIVNDSCWFGQFKADHSKGELFFYSWPDDEEEFLKNFTDTNFRKYHLIAAKNFKSGKRYGLSKTWLLNWSNYPEPLKTLSIRERLFDEINCFVKEWDKNGQLVTEKHLKWNNKME
tara:strand:- start:1214 stop:1879 length:666 start_codon:yes stop_codon:yes gene_type:complete